MPEICYCGTAISEGELLQERNALIGRIACDDCGFTVQARYELAPKEKLRPAAKLVSATVKLQFLHAQRRILQRLEDEGSAE